MGHHQPGRQRHVEEHMRDQDAGQPVDVEPGLQPQHGERAVDPALVAPQADDAEHHDERRQRQRQREEVEDGPPAGKPGRRARARATGSAKPTDRTVDSAACQSVKRTTRQK
jgi:hypothetical protein